MLALTIPATEFSTTVESLNVATAMEIRRGASPLAPTLDGEPRIRKPPLTLWMTAAAIRPGSMEKASSPDPAVRARGFDELTWQVRLPSVVTTVVALLAVYELAAMLLDPREGLWATIITGTTALLLFHARLAILDVQLLLWTAMANLAMAKCVLGDPGRRLAWSAVAGLALGLGLLAKGPVVLLMTAIPIGLACFRNPGRSGWAAIGLAAAIMAAVGGSWFFYVASHHPGAISVWVTDMARTDPGESGRTSWYSYWRLLPTLFPWSVLVVVGAVVVGRQLRSTGTDPAVRRRLWIIAFWVLVPIVLISFLRDRKVRYLVPVVPACAMLAARGISALRADRGTRMLTGAHWAIFALAVGGGAVGVAGGRFPQMLTPAGEPVFRMSWAVGGACVVAGLCAGCWWFSRAGGNRLVATTAGMMLGTVLFGSHALAGTAEAKSVQRPNAELIWREAPDAEVYQIRRRRGPARDLSIYLNRARRRVDGGLEMIERGRVPRFVVTYREREEDEAPLPEGWRVVGNTSRGRGEFVVYRLDPVP